MILKLQLNVKLEINLFQSTLKIIYHLCGTIKYHKGGKKLICRILKKVQLVIG